MGHVELLIHQHSQVLFHRAALDPFSIQPVLVLGIALTQLQDLAPGLVEFMRFTEAQLSSLSLYKVPSLWYFEHTTELGVISKPAQVVQDNVKCFVQIQGR